MTHRHARQRGRTARAWRAEVLLAATALVLVLPTFPAVAHPGGGFAPPHARLSADGNVVTVQWYAPPDDAAHVGEAVGYFPPGTMEAFLVGPDDALPTDDEVRELAASPALEAYFLEHVQIRQDGVPCAGEVEVAEDFLTEGADLTFRCPETVEEVDVRVTVLHDQDPRYDTFGVDGTVWTVLFTAAQPEHTWDAAAADGGGTGTVPLPLVVASALLVVALIAWWLFSRRLRRLRRRPPTYGAAGVRRGARHTLRRRRAASSSLDRS